MAAAVMVVVVVVVVEMAVVVFAWGLRGQGNFERGGMVVWLGNIPSVSRFE
jgi:hypothetical protein